MLFVEGLSDTLHGWVRAYNPTSLMDVISKTRDMIDIVPMTKAPIPTRLLVLQWNKDTCQPQREVGHGHIDDDTRRDLWRRKFCFTCQEPWAPRHKRTKGEAHYIEVYSNSDLEEEAGQEVDHGDDGPHYVGGAPPPPPHQGGGLFAPSGGILASLQGVLMYLTLWIRGRVQGQHVLVLVDGGAIQNFINSLMVEWRDIHTQIYEGLSVLAP